MQVGIVGINHKLADLKLREQLAKICQKRFGPGIFAHLDHSFVLLTTCNRTEVYFSSPDLAETHAYILNTLKQNIEGDYEQKLYSFFQKDCFAHLARVTSGLDSAIIFETEIQGQVKIAYEKACLAGFLPKDLHFLFQKSLHVGKKVRSKVSLEQTIPGLEQAIYQTGQHHFKNKPHPTILFVGASDINLKILGYLKANGLQNISLCNRTEVRAHHFAKKYQIRSVDWDALTSWHQYDWVIFGTKSPEYLISHPTFIDEAGSQKLIIDLCVPRNVDPMIGCASNITLVNIDQINRMLNYRKRRISDIIRGTERLLDQFSTRQIEIFQAKNMKTGELSSAPPSESIFC